MHLLGTRRARYRADLSPIGVVIILGFILLPVDAKCRWYGNCGTPQNPVPCTYSGEPKPLTNQTGLDILNQLCYGVFNGSTELCCDTGQLVEMSRSFAPAIAFLRRCPACLANFQRFYCHQTCSPDQAQFMAIQDYHGKSRWSPIFS